MNFARAFAAPWALALALFPAVAASSPNRPETVRLELGGRLERAASGEGFAIASGGARWDVDVSSSVALEALARSLEGGTVAIAGSYAQRGSGSGVVPMVRAVEMRRVERAPKEVRIRLHGPLKAGAMAIGAETTGVTVRAAGRDWELALAPRQLEEVGEWNGRTVSVDGRLEWRSGVEIARRAVVHVRRIAPARGEARPGAP